MNLEELQAKLVELEDAIGLMDQEDLGAVMKAQEEIDALNQQIQQLDQPPEPEEPEDDTPPFEDPPGDDSENPDPPNEPPVLTPPYSYELVQLTKTRDHYAEESGRLKTGAMWSHGNGATGYIGLPYGKGAFITAMYFHADVADKDSYVEISVRDYRSPSTSAEVVGKIVVKDCGDGVSGNAYLYQEFDTPLPIPEGSVLGFRTDKIVGNVSDARVGFVSETPIGNFLQVVQN